MGIRCRIFPAGGLGVSPSLLQFPFSCKGRGQGIGCYGGNHANLFTSIPYFQPSLLLGKPYLLVGRFVAGQETILKRAKGAIQDSAPCLAYQVVDEA